MVEFFIALIVAVVFLMWVVVVVLLVRPFGVPFTLFMFGKGNRRSRLRLLPTILLLGSFSSAQASHSAAPAARSQPLSDLPVWSTTLTQPNRYISAHGIRGFAGGYSEDGLEFWSFPLQLVNGYYLSFVLPKAPSFLRSVCSRQSRSIPSA